MRCSVLIIASLLLYAAQTANAQEPPAKGVTWIGEISLAYGGDTLATLFFTDGSSQNIKAGNGVTFSGGLLHNISDTYGVRYAVGWKASWSAADNLDVQKSAIPLDIVPFFRNGKHRFGAGVTYHMSPELDIETLGTSEFDNATGFIVEYGYAGFSFAYTGIDYTIAGTDFDASNIGLRYTFGF